jgi:hypothetical protein
MRVLATELARVHAEGGSVLVRIGDRLIGERGAALLVRRSVSRRWYLRRAPSRGKGVIMLRGMSTLNLWAEGLSAATRWYTELLAVEPYFTSEAAGRVPCPRGTRPAAADGA